MLNKTRQRRGDAELEWLVCLASTCEASQRRAPNVSDGTQQARRPRRLAAAWRWALNKLNEKAA